MLSQESQMVDENSSSAQNHHLSTKHDPLNDHDYCSPNKNLTQKRPLSEPVVSQDGGEPKEKRHKPKEMDSDFEQLSSSDYSSSDAESNQDSEYNSEDDPDRLWCVCQKPHGGKFMICCDICKDWFHGHCVGVTKLMGDRFEKQGKEWHCGECQEKLRAGIPRNAIPTKIVKKEKRVKKAKKVPIPGKRGRGRPRKSESQPTDQPTRASSRAARKSSSSLDPKYGVDNTRLRKNLARAEARSESFDSSYEDSQRLKELIKERKKSFFLKRRLAEQQKAARRNELGLGRQSLTANLSDGLDSLATSTNTPNMNNLPINIKSEHKERQKPNIVLQINTKKDAGADNGDANPRIVTAIVRSPKKSRHSESKSAAPNDLFTAEPIQISKKVKAQANTSPQTSTLNQISVDTAPSNSDNGTRKRSSSSSFSSKSEKSGGAEGCEHVTPKKRSKDSESSHANGSSTPINSKQIAQKIKESLEARYDQMKDLDVPRDKIEELATEIEAQLSVCFKEATKYLAKFRSLLFNLRDQKNQGLVRNVLSGEITPARLVKMSPDEMASHELAKWRERENKHSIELIKRDAELVAQQVIVKKTHKGEEVISNPSLNKPDDTASGDNQEPPTTPTKQSARDNRNDGSKSVRTPPPSTTTVSSGPLKMKIIGLGQASSIKPLNQDREASPSASMMPLLPFLDTTKEHKNHVYDTNCKICTKQQVDTPEEKSIHPVETDRKPNAVDTNVEQPKRIRVSIETKLDPANLSRLREPLIRPSEARISEPDEYNPEASPNALTSNQEEPGLEDDSYDPSNFQIVPTSTTPESTGTPASNEPCWSGTINMLDIAKFSASAKPVSGNLDFMREEIDQNLIACGRIAPDQVHSYIKKLRSTTKNQILVIQLFPLNPEDKVNFDSFFDYLYSRNRYGVIQAQALKDFYILPIHQKSSIPEIIKPIKGPGIDRREQNCLLGLLVRSKKSPTTASMSTSSSYTPTPLN